MPILGIMASQITGHLSTNSYESIATVTVGTAQTSITFSSIPSTYKHLQIRGIGKSDSSAATYVSIQFNGYNAANYSIHELSGDGSTASAYGAANFVGVVADPIVGTAYSNVFTGFVMDILDYQNTNKYKTTRYLGGHDTNSTNPYIFMTSGSWRNTAAISSITMVFSDSRKWNTYSQIALYGIKG